MRARPGSSFPLSSLGVITLRRFTLVAMMGDVLGCSNPIGLKMSSDNKRIHKLPPAKVAELIERAQAKMQIPGQKKLTDAMLGQRCGEVRPETIADWRRTAWYIT